jgi:hypothetical protein
VDIILAVIRKVVVLRKSTKEWNNDRENPYENVAYVLDI